MRRRLILAPLADSDLLKAHDWYEDRRKGLGKEFRAAVRQAIRQIRSRPEGRPFFTRDVRRVRVVRFPYWVYYQVSPGLITILTVFHASRNPADLQQALENRPLPDPEDQP